MTKRSYSFDRLIEILCALLFILAMSHGAVGHHEDGYVFLLALCGLAACIVWATLRSRDFLFRVALYPITVVLGYLALLNDMASYYGGFRDPSGIMLQVFPLLAFWAGIALALVIGSDRIALVRDNKARHGSTDQADR